MSRRLCFFFWMVVLSAAVTTGCGKKGPLELPVEKSEKVHGSL